MNSNDLDDLIKKIEEKSQYGKINIGEVSKLINECKDKVSILEQDHYEKIRKELIDVYKELHDLQYKSTHINEIMQFYTTKLFEQERKYETILAENRISMEQDRQIIDKLSRENEILRRKINEQ